MTRLDGVECGDTITYVNTPATRGAVRELAFEIPVYAVRDDGDTIVVRKPYTDRYGETTYTERKLAIEEFTRCSNCGRLMYYPRREPEEYADACPNGCGGDAE